MLICKGGSRAYKDFSSYARPQHCQAGVKGEPGRSPRNLQRKKAPQPKAKTESEEEAGRERYGQGTLPSEPKPLTHRTSAEEVLQQTNALALIENHVRRGLEWTLAEEQPQNHMAFAMENMRRRFRPTVALPVAISHKISLKPKLCASATLIQKTSN